MSRTMKKLRIVTTSWDDGSPNDLRVAELLHSRGLGGTFYVPFSHEMHEVLDGPDIRSLRRAGFEIGGHGISHVTLSGLSTAEIDSEVRVCKEKLEDILGERLFFFSYPRGRFNRRVQERLKMAGYQGARTTRMLSISPKFAPFEMGTTLHAFPHSTSAYVRNLLRAKNICGLCNYAFRLGRVDSWVELGRRLFDPVLREGGIWHLYGHSSEIDRLGLWPALGELLDYVARREDVLYLSNFQVLSLLRTETCLPTSEREILSV